MDSNSSQNVVPRFWVPPNSLLGDLGDSFGTLTLGWELLGILGVIWESSARFLEALGSTGNHFSGLGGPFGGTCVHKVLDLVGMCKVCKYLMNT